MSITYTPSVGTVSGITLVRGEVETHPQAGLGVRFALSDNPALNNIPQAVAARGVFVKASDKPDLQAIIEADRIARESAEEARFQKKYGKFIYEAKAKGEAVVVDSWMETRRAKEGGEWGEYQFAVTQYMSPKGKLFTKAVNCY